MMHDDLNVVVLQSVGLTVNEQQKIVDQDTRELLQYKGKNMRFSSTNSVPITKQDIVFDPSDNKGQMMALFEHFTHKIEDEDGTYIKMSCEIQDGDKTALTYEVDGQRVTTNPYYKESLKYVEAIERLNGCEDVSYLQQYDKKKEVPKKTRKRNKPIFG